MLELTQEIFLLGDLIDFGLSMTKVIPKDLLEHLANWPK